MSKLFTPSPTDLLNMIKAAEAKFDAARKEHLQDRAESAMRFNARVIRESRKNDVRRHVYASEWGRK